MLDIIAFKYSEINRNEVGSEEPRKAGSKTSHWKLWGTQRLYVSDEENKYGSGLSHLFYFFDGGKDKFKIHHTEDFLDKNEPYLIYVEYQPDSSNHGPYNQIKFVLELGLTSNHIENIKSGRAKIWFDTSPEGRIMEESNIKNTIEYLDKNQIPHENIIYSDGDVLVDELWGKYSKKINAIPFVTHCSNAYDSFKGLSKDNIWSNLILNQEYFLRPKHFMFNNFMPRTPRVLLMYNLVRDGLYKKGYCSFQEIQEDNKINFPSMGNATHSTRAFNLYELCGSIPKKEFDEWMKTLKPILPLTHDMMEIELDDLNNINYTTSRIDDPMTLAHSSESAKNDKGSRLLTHYDTTYGPYYNPISYLNVYFDICCETYSGNFGKEDGGFYNEPSCGPIFTEKIWRPLALGTPFIPISEPGTIRALKKLGFKTFDNIFDNSYDEVEDGRDRLDIIYENIKRLSSMSRTELHKLVYKSKKDMIHNHEYFINHFNDNVYREMFVKLKRIVNG